MTLLVDTSVWSLALRRDGAGQAREVMALREALDGAESVVTTGLVLQELLQGFSRPEARKAIIDRFGALPLIQRDKQDHIAAAHVPFRLWRHGQMPNRRRRDSRLAAGPARPIARRVSRAQGCCAGSICGLRHRCSFVRSLSPTTWCARRTARHVQTMSMAIAAGAAVAPVTPLGGDV